MPVALALLDAAAGISWMLAARTLYARWNGRLRRHRTCPCGQVCPRCLATPAQVAATAMAAALVWPVLALAALVRWRQPDTFTERLAAIEGEQEIVEAECRRLDEARAAMRASRAAWITEAERHLGIGEHGN